MFAENFSNRLRQLSEYSFLAAIFLLPFAKAGFEIFFVLSLIFWILEKIITRKLEIDRSLIILVFLLILSSSVSAFYSGYPELSMKGIIKLVKYILVMLIGADLFSRSDQLKRLLVAGFINLFLVLLDSLIQNVWGKDLLLGNPVHYPNEQIRLTGPYKSYGLLAAQLILFVPILLSLLSLTMTYLKRIGIGFIFLLTLFILYQTQSRGAWLAAFGSLIVYSFLTRNKWYFAILAIAVVVAPVVLPKNVLFHLDQYSEQDASLVERKLLWNRAISVIKEEPLFGCGINTYIKNYPKYIKGEERDLLEKKARERGNYAIDGQSGWQIPGHPDQIPNHYVHNGYLQLAAETGLISLAIFLVILGQSFTSGFLALKKTSANEKIIVIGLICGLLALLLQVMVDTTLHNLQSAVFIWLFIGLLFAIKKMKEVSV